MLTSREGVARRDEGPAGRSATLSDHELVRDGSVVVTAGAVPFSMLVDHLLDGFAVHELVYDGEGRPVDYRFLAVNPAFERQVGLTAAEVVGRRVTEVLATTDPTWLERYARVVETGETARFRQYSAPLGKHYEVTAFRPCAGQFACVFRDITAEEQLAEERRATVELLRRLNASGEPRELLHAAGLFLQNWSGCEAIGIRLADGEDYPYVETLGLSAELVEAERSLCARDADGQPLQAPDGRVVLECLCGQLLTHPERLVGHQLTDQGSFWTNGACALPWARMLSETRSRGRCVAEGYQSLALIPLHANGVTLGLVQLADRRPDRFTAHTIALLERLCDSVATALAQRQADLALRESQLRLDQALVGSGNGLWDYDVATDSVYCSPTWKHQLGYADDELPSLQSVFIERLHPDDRERVAAAMATAVTEPSPNYQIEFRLRHRDGSYRWILSRAAIHRGLDGTPSRVLGTHLDITDRKLAEEALQARTEELDRFFDLSLDLLCIVDNGGSLRRLNDAWVTTLGFPREELLGRRWQALVHPDDADRAAEAGHQLRVTGQLNHFVCRMRHRDGSDRWLEWRGSAHDGVLYAAGRDITERVHNDQVLRETQHLIRRVFDSTPNLIFICDLEAHALDLANRPVSGFLGCPGDELAGLPLQHLRERVHPADHHHPSGAHARLLAAADDTVVETAYRLRRADGEWRWLRFREVVFGRNAAGRVTHTLGIAEDITDERDAREALRQGEERYRSIVRTSLSGFWIVDGDARLVDVNDAYCRMTGYDRSELLGRSAADLEVDLTSAELTTHMRRLIATGSERFETRHRRRDGEVVDLEASVTYLPDEHRYCLFLTDITARKRAEEQLHASEALYASLVENLPQLVFRKDLEGRFVFVNQRLADLLRRPIADILGRTDAELHLPEVAEAFRREDQAVLTQREPQHQVTEFHPADGPAVVLQGTRVPLYDADGRLVGLQGIFADITEQRLLEDQLRQAQKMESVGRLAGGVAHDFNNLLSPILGYSDMLLTGMPPTDPRYDDLEQIRLAADRARALTRQLLAFGRKQVLELRAVDLRPVLNSLAKLLRRTIREDIRIELLLPERLGTVMADVGQIEQVVMNLAINAQDAMPDGGLLVLSLADVRLDGMDVAELPGTVTGGYVELSVSDTGIGMDDATRQRVFEPFYTTKERGKGTGLGLATAYGIIQQHAGTIVVRSTLGHGSLFRVLLPRTDAPVELPDDEDAIALQAPCGETIVVVDDDGGTRRLAERVLAEQGYHVIAAASGEECIRRLMATGEPAQLLLTDVVMPGINGRQLYELLARQRPGLKVVYMSGHPDDVIAERGALERGLHFLQKPFSLPTLAHAVRRALDG